MSFADVGELCTDSRLPRTVSLTLTSTDRLYGLLVVIIRLTRTVSNRVLLNYAMVRIISWHSADMLFPSGSNVGLLLWMLCRLLHLM